mgnify:CR=1 FL=1
MSSLDEEWSNYLSENIQENYNKKEDNIETNKDNIPECEPLYISTKTKVLFLNQTIDLNDIFWKIPILEYSKPQNGVIKKQMKFVSKCIEELDETKDKLKNDLIQEYQTNTFGEDEDLNEIEDNSSEDETDTNQSDSNISNQDEINENDSIEETPNDVSQDNSVNSSDEDKEQY